MTWCSSCQSSYDDGDGIDGACGVCPTCIMKEHEAAEATGPCIGCGERNHTAHNVSICGLCATKAKAPVVDSRTPRKSQGDVALALTHFEASMVLCVLAVAKAGQSQFDAADAPVRRRALEQAYAKLSASLGVEEH